MAIRFHVLCLMCFTPWLVPFIFRGNLLSRELSCSPVSTTLSPQAIFKISQREPLYYLLSFIFVEISLAKTRLWSWSPLISYQLYWVMSALLKITIEMNKWDATMPRATFSAGNAWEKLMHPLPAQDTRWLPSSPSSSPAQDTIMICCHPRSLKKSKNEQNKYITSSQEWLIKCASIDPEELHSTCQKVHAASKFSICYDPSNTELLIYLSEDLRYDGSWLSSEQH